MMLKQIRELDANKLTIQCYLLKHPENKGFNAGWTDEETVQRLAKVGLDYGHDLNAALSLIPSDAPRMARFEEALMAVLDNFNRAVIWRYWIVGKSPANICQAYLLWKGNA